MRIIQATRTLPTPLSGSVLTIGNFDGVHLGHRELIGRLVSRARQTNLPAVVLTFEPHPVKVLYPDRKLQRIFDLDDQLRELETCGVDVVVVEPFSREFSQIVPERYVLEWIFRPFLPETVVVGYDFSFGAYRQGSIEFLQERSEALGFRVEVIPPVRQGDVLVSSSRIRNAVETGDVQLAEKLLGRKFYISGLVERGAGRGRVIGVPTANLRTGAELVPKPGVYAAWAEVRGKRWKSAVNIGFNPTFSQVTHGLGGNGQAFSIEAHLIDFPYPVGANPVKSPEVFPELYGERVRLEFCRRLRDEQKFPSVVELVAQIKADIGVCTSILNDSKEES